MASFVRGTTLSFSATCTDKDGNALTPDTANLYLVYLSPAGVLTKQTVAMSIAGNVASVAWDSIVAQEGRLTWSIRATGGGATIVTDGVETLLANGANQAA